MRTLPLILAAIPCSANAQDGMEHFFGGGLSTNLSASRENGAYVEPNGTQAEVDAMLGWGWGHVRVDYGVHFDPSDWNEEGIVAPAYPGPWPEWAMVQLGREAVHLRMGVFNPNIGLEDWDPWTNYTSAYSVNFLYAGAGRFVGAEASATTRGGVDLFAYGGYDVDWESYGGGVGVATEQDAFSTWSGVTVYPSFDKAYCHTGADCLNVLAHLSFEFYPADPLWITLDTANGFKDDSFYSSSQLVVNVIPEAVVNPFARGELVIDPDDALLSGLGGTASLGVRTDALDWLRVGLEGKLDLYKDGTVDPGGFLVLGLHVPEPSPYAYQDPFGAEEEE